MGDWSALLRDLLLLVAGAILTLFGSWFTERHRERREERQWRHARLEKRLEPVKQYVDSLIAASDVWYDLEVRAAEGRPRIIPPFFPEALEVARDKV